MKAFRINKPKAWGLELLLVFQRSNNNKSFEKI